MNDMYETQSTADGTGVSSVGPQLAAAKLDDTVGMVTLTIGGNDLGFAKVVKHCFEHRNCADDVFDDSFDDDVKSELSLSDWVAHHRLLPVGQPAAGRRHDEDVVKDCALFGAP